MILSLDSGHETSLCGHATEALRSIACEVETQK